MNKELFVKNYAGKLGTSKAEAEKAYDAFVDTFVEGLETDGVVDLTKFMKAEVKVTGARKGRNPSTGAEIDIPEGKRIGIKPLKYIKDVIGK